MSKEIEEIAKVKQHINIMFRLWPLHINRIKQIEKDGQIMNYNILTHYNYLIIIIIIILLCTMYIPYDICRDAIFFLLLSKNTKTSIEWICFMGVCVCVIFLKRRFRITDWYESMVSIHTHIHIIFVLHCYWVNVNVCCRFNIICKENISKILSKKALA